MDANDAAALGRRIDDLNQELTALRREVAALRSTPQISDDSKLSVQTALLEDANSWAQHFSNVRLGLTTFLLAVSLGIMQFRWDNPSWIVFGGAIAVWGVACVLFMYFTILEYGKIADIQKSKPALLRLLGHPAAAKEHKWWQEAPFWCLIVMTLAFAGVCVAWSYNLSVGSSPMTSTGGASAGDRISPGS